MKKKELSEYDKYLIKEEWIDTTASMPTRTITPDDWLIGRIKKIIRKARKNRTRDFRLQINLSDYDSKVTIIRR